MIPITIEWLLIPVIVAIFVYLARHYLFTFQALFRKSRQLSYLQVAGAYTPKVTVLIPAHNEEGVIGNLLQRMADLTYPKDKLEVVVIDDGSTDKTPQIVDEYATNYPFIKSIHRSDGGLGKPSALNCGSLFSNGEIVLTFDADYFPQLDIVEKLVAPFIDPEVGAVQGRVTVVNEEDSLVSKIVTLERTGGYRIDQLARDDLDLIPQYGGTVGGFRRETLKEVGGWVDDNLTEDTDLTCRIALKGYKIRYVNDAECYEEAVKSWRAYWNQRYRWARGHMQCAVKYLGKFLRSEYLGFWKKLEMTLLLSIYFIPVIVLAGWLAGLTVYLTGTPSVLPYFFALLSTTTYSAVGNFAPFFEIGTGAYLDDRGRLLWWLPALLIAFFVNVFCCTKAFLDLLVDMFGRRAGYKWVKTKHIGNNFNNYVNHFNNWNNNNHNGRNSRNGRNNHNGLARRYGEFRE